jgi:hypothetical protein
MDVPFVRCSRTGYGCVAEEENLGHRLMYEHIAQAEHTGNESRNEEDDVIYFSAACIVETATPWARRHAAVAQYAHARCRTLQVSS